MLSRKLSDYIFYGILAAILLIVVMIRVVTLGNQNDRISELERNNILLQTQIDALEETVENNKNVQTNQLYELYSVIPNVFSNTGLTYKTVAILEELGIDEQDDYQRTVYINHDVIFDADDMFYDINEKYFVVEVQLYFTTSDVDVINDLIDSLYNEDQLFIINYLNYNNPSGEDFIGVYLNFLAIYDLDIEEES